MFVSNLNVLLSLLDNVIKIKNFDTEFLSLYEKTMQENAIENQVSVYNKFYNATRDIKEHSNDNKLFYDELQSFFKIYYYAYKNTQNFEIINSGYRNDNLTKLIIIDYVLNRINYLPQEFTKINHNIDMQNKLKILGYSYDGYNPENKYLQMLFNNMDK